MPSRHISFESQPLVDKPNRNIPNPQPASMAALPKASKSRKSTSVRMELKHSETLRPKIVREIIYFTVSPCSSLHTPTHKVATLRDCLRRCGSSPEQGNPWAQPHQYARMIPVLDLQGSSTNLMFRVSGTVWFQDLKDHRHPSTNLRAVLTFCTPTCHMRTLCGAHKIAARASSFMEAARSQWADGQVERHWNRHVANEAKYGERGVAVGTHK